MKVWLSKICRILQKPKYENTTGSWVEYDNKGKITACCALGELCVRAKCKPSRIRIDIIINTLIEKYKVPANLVDELFHKINHSNIYGVSKETIAKLLKNEYGRL